MPSCLSVPVQQYPAPVIEITDGLITISGAYTAERMDTLNTLHQHRLSFAVERGGEHTIIYLCSESFDYRTAVVAPDQEIKTILDIIDTFKLENYLKAEALFKEYESL